MCAWVAQRQLAALGFDNGCIPVCSCLGMNCSWQSIPRPQGRGHSVCAWVAQRQLAALGFVRGYTPVCLCLGVDCSWQSTLRPQGLGSSVIAQQHLAAQMAGSLAHMCFTVWRVHSRVRRLAKYCVRLGREVAAGGVSSTPSPTGSLASGRGALLGSHGNSYAGLWILAAFCFGCWQNASVLEGESETGESSSLNFSELD